MHVGRMHFLEGVDFPRILVWLKIFFLQKEVNEYQLEFKIRRFRNISSRLM